MANGEWRTQSLFVINRLEWIRKQCGRNTHHACLTNVEIQATHREALCLSANHILNNKRTGTGWMHNGRALDSTAIAPTPSQLKPILQLPIYFMPNGYSLYSPLPRMAFLSLSRLCKAHSHKLQVEMTWQQRKKIHKNIKQNHKIL